jgi:S1-C subfamily serine protease
MCPEPPNREEPEGGRDLTQELGFLSL